MQAHIQGLEKLLDNCGVQVQSWDWSPYRQAYQPPRVKVEGSNSDEPGVPLYGWSQVNSIWVKDFEKPEKVAVPALTRNSTCNTQISSSGDCQQQSISSSSITNSLSAASTMPVKKGTDLSVLGFNLDVSAFNDIDFDQILAGMDSQGSLYNKSLDSCMRSIMNVNTALGQPHLPIRGDVMAFVEWYFAMIYPFNPILHKPSFMNLVSFHSSISRM